MKTLKINNEVIIYLFVGIMTTIVSWGACLIARLFLDSNYEFQNFIINTIGWMAGVFFAYPLNRKWVFKSTNKKILKELFSFICSRISTWILDIFIMWFFVNIFPLNTLIITISQYLNLNLTLENIDSLNYWISKIFISSVLVFILNYVFSKLFIFKKSKSTIV